jgi:hypothetical protein
MSARTKKITLSEVGVAAGFVAMFLFGILYGATGHPAALVAGCGGGLLLLAVSLLSAQASNSKGPASGGSGSR